MSETANRIRLGSKASLARDASHVGEVVGFRRLGGVLYATVAWVKDHTWSTSAPVSKLVVHPLTPKDTETEC